MKRIITIFMSLALIFVLAACANNEVKGDGTSVPTMDQDTQQTVDNGQEDIEKGTTTPTVPATTIDDVNETPKESSVKEFQMTAKQFTFDPEVIGVNKGDKVRLIITSTDITHGIRIPEYGINEQLPVGKPVTIEFTADKQGSFTSYCSVACGAGHGKMKGSIVVK